MNEERRPVKLGEMVLNFDNFLGVYNHFKRRMSSNQRESSKKYDTISLENRKTLVRLVVDEERSISKSAKKLGIKLSTAKLIIRKYKTSGDFFERKKDRQSRERAELKVQEQNRNDLYGQNNNALPEQALPFAQGTQPAENAQQYPLVNFVEPSIYIFNYFPGQMYWM